MLGCHIPPHHIFLAINIQNSEVGSLHKFEQALPYDLHIGRVHLKHTCHRRYAAPPASYAHVQGEEGHITQPL